MAGVHDGLTMLERTVRAVWLHPTPDGLHRSQVFALAEVFALGLAHAHLGPGQGRTEQQALDYIEQHNALHRRHPIPLTYAQRAYRRGLRAAASASTPGRGRTLRLLVDAIAADARYGLEPDPDPIDPRFR